MWWPEWDGVAPLSFGVGLDFAALSLFDSGFPLPVGGTLLSSCHDRHIEHELFVDVTFPTTQADARVVYVPAGTPVRPRAIAESLRGYPARPVRRNSGVRNGMGPPAVARADRGIERLDGTSMGIVVGGSIVSMQWVREDLWDCRVRVSPENDADDTLVEFAGNGQHSEVGRRWWIAVPTARAALRHYVLTGELTLSVPVGCVLAG